MLYNRCTGVYKFGNNTYPRRIRHRSNLGHIFHGKKCVLWAGKYSILIVTLYFQRHSDIPLRKGRIFQVTVLKINIINFVKNFCGNILLFNYSVPVYYVGRFHPFTGHEGLTESRGIALLYFRPLH